MKFYSSNVLFLSFIIVIFLNSAGLSKTNTRDVPVNAQERARKKCRRR